MDIPYIFLIYSIYIFPSCVKYVFLEGFALNWSFWCSWTCQISDFSFNFTNFGFRNVFLTKILNDSAWFLLEKLKKHVILTKNPNIQPKIPKIQQTS